jgi:hypothetical protein
MANPVWPVSLPQGAFINSWQEEPADGKVLFQVEVGPSKTRRRISKPGRLIDHSIIMTTTQRATLFTFYETTIKGGSLEFDWIHPIDGGAAVTWMFEEAPKFQPLSGKLWQATYKLRLMP